MLQTVYRRELPSNLVAFSSVPGRALFREALAHGTMEGWFALAEQYHTQAEPAYCGLGSLVVALNALGVDPRRPWKGQWRWYSEEMLDCCVQLSEIRKNGISLDELGCLARCNELTADIKHADRCNSLQLHADLLAASKGDGSVVIASYSR
jgi:glutathione gamma-glutamylcysteinyltransferase